MKKLLLSVLLLCLFSGMLWAQATYVGSQTCATCHSDKYTDWSASGHPYKFSVIQDNQPPTYPDFVINFEDQWMDSLGSKPHTWDEIAGVIGGFGWKSRFVGTDGIIVGTASSTIDPASGHNQFNFYGGVEHGWVNYDVDHENKYYNYGCFKCHTTGPDTSGTWLEGVADLGTFAESGIGCESCHGPGSEHAKSPSKTNIDRVYEFAHLDNAFGGLVYAEGDTVRPDAESNDVNFLCGTCHNRSYTAPINSKGGFIKHHEQWDEFIASEHFEQGFTCITCHDPHKRVIWGGDGITITCETCHTKEAGFQKHNEYADCIDCHMPYAAKSGTTQGQSGYKGDIRSHLFKIIPDTLSIFTESGSDVRDDETRPAALSPAYSCLGCHNDSPTDSIPDMTLAQAAAAAEEMHEPTAIQTDEPLPTRYALKQNYPNPFNPSTTIEFTLPQASITEIAVFDVTGKKITTLMNQYLPAGVHKVRFDASALAAGVYMAKMVSGDYVAFRKMVLIK